MKNVIKIMSFILLVAISCQRQDPNEIYVDQAPEFQGSLAIGPEVDLGLSAIWSSCNIGATDPSQCGEYFSWGEIDSKSAYTEEDYFHAGKLLNGQQLPMGYDAATVALGYGWRTPSIEDWQELIDNCSISYASIDGQNGYVVTSRVEGYEGTSLFFPCAGYRAEARTNNIGVQALYWSDRLVSDVSTRAVNAFFTEATGGYQLLLNMPPKGVGGLVWCGYPVRGIRKFSLNWDGQDVNVDRLTTQVSFRIQGNAEWSVSADNGAVCSPATGVGDGSVVVSFPENETYNQKQYNITLTSPEFQDAKSFVITQFGIVPDFKFAAQSATVAWEEEQVEVRLDATSDVSWSGSVVYSDGTPVEGAMLTPASGIGAADIQVSIPSSTNIYGTTSYFVKLVSSDTRIPADLQTITCEIVQERCEWVPYGTVWANSFLKAWDEAGFVAKQNFAAENAVASISHTTPSLSNPGKDNGYMKGQFKFSFTVSQTGIGILDCYVYLAGASHAFEVSATRDGVKIFSKKYSPGEVAKHHVECEMELQKGDVVTISYSNGSNNARLYCGATSPIIWKKGD